MKLKRLLKHWSCGHRSLHKAFPVSSLKKIEQAVADSEKKHSGQIRFAVEHALGLKPLFHDQSARQRALEIFARLHIWDTEHNNGVLIYLLLADRSLEIIADRGIDKLVTTEGWRDICRQTENMFRQGKFEEGVLHAIEMVSKKLVLHFPDSKTQANEIPDHPVIL